MNSLNLTYIYISHVCAKNGIHRKITIHLFSHLGTDFTFPQFTPWVPSQPWPSPFSISTWPLDDWGPYLLVVLQRYALNMPLAVSYALPFECAQIKWMWQKTGHKGRLYGFSTEFSFIPEFLLPKSPQMAFLKMAANCHTLGGYPLAPAYTHRTGHSEKNRSL